MSGFPEEFSSLLAGVETLPCTKVPRANENLNEASRDSLGSVPPVHSLRQAMQIQEGSELANLPWGRAQGSVESCPALGPVPGTCLAARFLHRHQGSNWLQAGPRVGGWG